MSATLLQQNSSLRVDSTGSTMPQPHGTNNDGAYRSTTVGCNLSNCNQCSTINNHPNGCELDFTGSNHLNTTVANPENYTDDEERISIWILLPEQFARRLNISLNRRTPVLDLIVYLSSLFRFNPADFVLGFMDREELRGFRVLLPNSCIGSAGSLTLQLAEKKHVMNTFFGDDGCLRQTYNNQNQHLINPPLMKKCHPTSTTAHPDACVPLWCTTQSAATDYGSNQQPPQNGDLDNLVNSTKSRSADVMGEAICVPIHLPDGRQVTFREPVNSTLGQLFHKVCRRYNLDPNHYSIQTEKSEYSKVRRTGCNTELLTSSVRLNALPSYNAFYIVPALKACDLAESESSVDRMYRRHLADQQHLQSDNSKQTFGHDGKISSRAGAVKTLVAGTMMPNASDGLGLFDNEGGGDVMNKDDDLSQKLTKSLNYDPPAHSVHGNRIDPMLITDEHRFFKNGDDILNQSRQQSDGYIDQILKQPRQTALSTSIYHPPQESSMSRRLAPCIFPQGQNSLDLPLLKRYHKQRAPLPPSLKQNYQNYMTNRHHHDHRYHINDPLINTSYHQTSNDFGYMSYRSGRAHSAGSTMDDISEDFRQVIKLGSTIPELRDKATQTLASGTLTRGPQKPVFVSREIQTPNELLLLTSSDSAQLPLVHQNAKCSEVQTQSIDGNDSVKFVKSKNKSISEITHKELKSKKSSLTNVVSIIAENDRINEASQKKSRMEKSTKNVIQQRETTSVDKDKSIGDRNVAVYAISNIRKTSLDTKNQFTQSDQPCEHVCKECTKKETDTPTGKQQGMFTKKKFFNKLHGATKQNSVSTNTLPKSVAAIINEESQLMPAVTDARTERNVQQPVELQVTEKTTTVECTVTVTAEGKSVSAVARPATTCGNPLSANDHSVHSNRLCLKGIEASPPSPDGPRPYSRNTRFRRFDEKDRLPSASPDSYRPLSPDNRMARSFHGFAASNSSPPPVLRTHSREVNAAVGAASNVNAHVS